MAATRNEAAASATPRTAALPAIKEAGSAAIVAAVLSIPLLALKAHNTAHYMDLATRWEATPIAAASVFLGRLAMIVLGRSSAVASRASRLFAGLGRKIHENMTSVSLVGLAVGIAFPFIFHDRYSIYNVTTFLIYVMLGWGLNIVVGLAGLLDLGYVAFYAFGSYSYALFATEFGWSFWACLPLAGMLSAFFGVILGFPVLRLRGDYLAIVTLGFGEMVRVVLINWYDLTGGPDGVYGIPEITFFGIPFTHKAGGFSDAFGLVYDTMHRMTFLYFVILALAVLTTLFTQRMRKLPTGRAWEALREDEIACRSLGVNPANVKLSAFALGAMFAGFAGSFFAVRSGFISPESFTFLESATILAIVVLGGMGSQLGVVIAAAFVVFLPEVSRAFHEYRMLLFGLAMVLIMVWRPRGLLAFRDPTIRLHPKGRGA